ncbi:hypothetical protein [Saccharothrix hoggarensis]|uniref:XPB/Ssl2-like helicase family protein n=1 Tax=Saccharothrix hoggarensis TaxID=913853 RepID=A0ABW3QCZ6_9PSEU
MPRRELADLLNTTTDDLPTETTTAWRMINLITRLPTRTMLLLATLTRIDAPTIASVLQSPRSPWHTTPDTDVADLTALLLRHHPTAMSTDTVAEQARWPVPRVQAAAIRLHDNPPPGVALHIEGDTLALRPEPRYLRDPTARGSTTEADAPSPEQVPSTVAVDHDIARDLYLLLTDPTTRIPAERVAALRAAGILTPDDHPRPAADVRYSLQWWDQPHRTAPG